MLQRVNHIAYMAKVNLSLSELEAGETKDIILLPKGAELFHFSVEVLEEATGVNADFGVKDAKDLLINDLDLGVKTSVLSQSIKEFKEQSLINVTLNSKARSGEIAVRAVYFLPSQIVAEF